MKIILGNILILYLLISCESTGTNINNSGVERPNTQKITEKTVINSSKSQLLIGSDLKTDTAKTSISISDILDGGPGKDGIPSIDNPTFLSIEKASKSLSYLTDDSQGMNVNIGGDSRFYPYSILVWHEIVNDTINGIDIAVTFCPLCGSAIVYNRDIGGEILSFGVSGKLYQSNMLMYDRKTESLWSQSLGKSVVGDYLDTPLEYIDSDLLTFEEFKNNFPTGKVLSDNTGYDRQYGYIPYEGYEESDHLFFPVKGEDLSFKKKEMFYIINDSGESMAFNLAKLRKNKIAELTVGDNSYSLEFRDGIITATKNNTKKLPGYYEMWFSWITHNMGSKNVWNGSK